MKRTLTACALGAATLAVTSVSGAQELGTKGDAIFSAERIFGIRGEHVHVDYAAGEDRNVDATTISIGLARPVVPYNIPRIGFDYMVIDKLSVGGALGYSSIDADENGPGGSETYRDFIFSPRVGYLHMFGKVAGIWPRGGFTYQSTTLEDVASEWTLALNIECNFPIVFTPHFGILLGAAFDQSFAGNRDPENGPDQDITYRSFGVQVGLFGWI
jgi:hypothetical protein